MNTIKVQRTRRVAIPYIVNLLCECGGRYIKDEPIVFDYPTSTIKHTCNKCGKSINCKEAYPATINISDQPEEAFDTIEVLENVNNVIGL